MEYVGKHERAGNAVPHNAEYKAKHVSAEMIIAEIEEFFAELELSAEELATAAGILADNARKIADIGRKIRLRKIRHSRLLYHGPERKQPEPRLCSRRRRNPNAGL